MNASVTEQRRRSRKRRARSAGIKARLGGLVGSLVVFTAVGLFARAALAGLSGATAFTVEVVRVEGARYLDPASLLALARPGDLKTGAVSQEDLEAMGERVAAHPLVEQVAVRRSLPAAVVIDIVERVPVAFLGTEPLGAVDADGQLLNGIEPARYGSLPFITGVVAEGDRVNLKRAVEAVIMLREHAPRLLDRTSEIRVPAPGEVTLVLVHDAVRIRIEERRMVETLPLVEALVADGRERYGNLAEVDLRFAGTVIYRERNTRR